MQETLEQLRDRMLVRSPAARFVAEHGLLAMARFNRALGLNRNGQFTVMFHPGRTGSQVLGTQLAQNPHIFWDNELFWGSRLDAYRALRVQRFDPLRILTLAPHKTLKPWYGFEIKPQDFSATGLEPSDLIRQLKSQGLQRCIVLQRKNLLRRYISGAVLQLTGKAHLGVKDKPLRQLVRLNIDHFFDQAWRMQSFYRALDHQLKHLEVLRLSYEEHIETDPGIAYQRVTDFLGVESLPIKVKLRKSNPFPIHELIENYAQVARRLAASEYAWMLDEEHP